MESQPASQQKRILIGLAAVVVLVAIVVGVFALTGDDDDGSAASTTTSTTEATSSSTGATTTTVDAAVADAALFPGAGASDDRFDDPQAVAEAFARQVLGFREDVLVGDFAAGDNRSGEVEIRSHAAGDPTTILVRQLAGEDWSVIGAVTERIRLDTPTNGAHVSSPQPLLGAAHAFEGTVNVVLYADGSVAPIANSFVTGRGDEMGDFSGDLEFDVPDGVTRGVLVLREPSGEDGSTVVAAAIRVLF